MMEKEMIKTEKLVFKYTKYEQESDAKTYFTALKGVDLVIEKGSFTAILGHNGSGKSTLAKHMNVLLAPTEGTVWVKGYDTKVAENIWPIRQSTGMVFQNPDNQLIATIVEEDVAFGPENLGVPPEEIRQRVTDALQWVGMEEFRRNAPNLLSGGQKQRIAIAGILAMKPECIVLDEPTAMLDPIGRREVIAAVTKMNKEEGITTILITHYMEEAVKADRVIVMDDGLVALDGTPKEIFSQVDRLKAIGLDVPQVTEIAYHLGKKGMDIPLDIITIEEMADYLCQLQSRI